MIIIPHHCSYGFIHRFLMDLNPFKIMVSNYRGVGLIWIYHPVSIIFHHLSPISHHFPIIFPWFLQGDGVHHPCSHHFSPDFHGISIGSMVEFRLFRPTPADALPPQGWVRGLGQGVWARINGKIMDKSWENWENHRKTMGKLWTNHGRIGKIIRQPWENHGNIEGWLTSPCSLAKQKGISNGFRSCNSSTEPRMVTSWTTKPCRSTMLRAWMGFEKIPSKQRNDTVDGPAKSQPVNRWMVNIPLFCWEFS